MKKLIVLAAAALLSFSALAQDFQTGYFMDNYIYSYRLNPAFRPSRNFIGLPVISNVGAGLQGNVGIDSFLFPVSDGKLATFMHPEVDSRAFLDGLKSQSKLALNLNANVLAFGFKTGPLYHFVDVNFRNVDGISVPYELFSFLKDGVNGTIEVPDVRFDSQSFVEAAYGANLKIGGLISVGGRIKVLVGLENISMNVSNLSVSESGGEWSVSAKGELQAAIDGLDVKTKTSDDGLSHDIIDMDSLDDIDFGGPSGYGAALDLGATLTPFPGLHLSVSLTDLGGIKWKYPLSGSTSNASWNYNGDSDDPLDDLGNLLEFHQKAEDSGFKALPATARLGAEFKPLPAVGLGLLLTHRFGDVPWTEARASVTGNVFHVAEAAVSAGYGDFGFSFGAALGLDLKAVNLFIGLDSIPTSFTPQYVPLGNANMAFTFGLNITFGGGKFLRL